MWRAAPISLLAAGLMFGQDSNPPAPFAGRQFSSEQAATAEAALAANPEDVSARLNLLGYYWAHANSADRANHLLWLIANHPELSVFQLPEAALSDPAANEQLRQAWGQAVTTHSDDWRVLSNAAWFYRLPDKRQSIDLLLRALASNPSNRQIADRLGYEYAVILAGVTEVDLTGRPSRFDPAEARSDFAQSVRAELEKSAQAAVLSSAGGALNSFLADAKKAGSELGLGSFAGELNQRAKAIDPSLTPQRIRVGGNVQAANILKSVPPVYPPLALQARIQGVVRFSVILAKDGSVQNVELVSGHPLLVAPAVEAVKQWTYKATLLNGLPVEVATTIDVNFTIGN